MELEHKLQVTKLLPVLMTMLHEENDILLFEFIIIKRSIIGKFNSIMSGKIKRNYK